MEGKFSKGHLNGVLAVMSKFLSIIKCSKIYMGKKDYQQLNLIKNLIKLNKIKCSIIECKTIRMKNGGALSSRNLLLSNDALLVLGKVYRFLKLYKKYGGGLLFGFVSLVIVLAKMHYAIGVLEAKIKVAFELINKMSEHKHD